MLLFRPVVVGTHYPGRSASLSTERATWEAEAERRR